MNSVIKFIRELKEDINRPEGRWGIHGHEAVEDDYFLALEYVVKQLEKIVENNLKYSREF